MKGRVSLEESMRDVHLVRELILCNFRPATVCGLGLRVWGSQLELMTPLVLLPPVLRRLLLS